jgi:hypothetical protein
MYNINFARCHQAAVLVALTVTIYLATRGVEGGVCAPTCFVKTDAGTSICDTDCNHDAQVAGRGHPGSFSRPGPLRRSLRDSPHLHLG